MRSFKEVNAEWEESQAKEKERISSITNPHKRRWEKLKSLFLFPWKWVWVNIRDWKTFIIFVIVFLVVSSEVWGLYLIGWIFDNNWCVSAASACWLFWLGPGTPFMVIVIFLTIATKAALNKINRRGNSYERKRKKPN